MRSAIAITIGLLVATASVQAFAQVGGGNDLPSSATQPKGTGGTANTPQNNGVASPGAGGSAGTMGAGGANGQMMKGGSIGAGGAGAGGSMGSGAAGVR